MGGQVGDDSEKNCLGIWRYTMQENISILHYKTRTSCIVSAFIVKSIAGWRKKPG